MTGVEQAWVAEVLSAFTSEGVSDGLVPRAGEVDYLDTFRRLYRGSTSLAALGLRVAIWMVAFAPLWLLYRGVTISRLSRAERTALLARLLSHRSFAVRELTLLLKLTAAMALFASSSLRARSGYDGDARASAAEQRRPVIAAPSAEARRLPVLATPHDAAPAIAIAAASEAPGERVVS